MFLITLIYDSEHILHITPYVPHHILHITPYVHPSSIIYVLYYLLYPLLTPGSHNEILDNIFGQF